MHREHGGAGPVAARAVEDARRCRCALVVGPSPFVCAASHIVPSGWQPSGPSEAAGPQACLASVSRASDVSAIASSRRSARRRTDRPPRPGAGCRRHGCGDAGGARRRGRRRVRRGGRYCRIPVRVPGRPALLERAKSSAGQAPVTPSRGLIGEPPRTWTARNVDDHRTGPGESGWSSPRRSRQSRGCTSGRRRSPMKR